MQGSLRSADGEVALRFLYQTLLNGWNSGTGELLAAPFTEDADFIGYDGTQLKGRSEIASFHQQLFSWFLKDTRMVGKVRAVKFLKLDVAVIQAVGGLILPGQEGLEPTRNSVHTLVAVYEEGAWKIAALQNTRISYIGRPGAAEQLAAELRELV